MTPEYGRLYLADLSPRLGTEAGKVRPVLVVQSNMLNDTGHASTWVLSCTTRIIEGENILRVHLPKGVAANQRACDVMIDQSRAIDNRRFVRALDALPQALIREVKTKLRLLAEL